MRMRAIYSPALFFACAGAAAQQILRLLWGETNLGKLFAVEYFESFARQSNL